MDNIKYSPKEWKPLTAKEKLENQIAMVDSSIVQIESEKRVVTDRKNEVQLEMAILTNRIRAGKNLPNDEYESICQRQNDIKREIYSIEKKLSQFKEDLKKLNNQKDNLKHMVKSVPVEVIESALIEMRDKYMAFAADSTRVSSMRAMSSKFVEEIQSILSVIK